MKRVRYSFFHRHLRRGGWLARTWNLCGALALVALLAACGASPPETGFARTPKVGGQAPEFALPDATGKPVRLSELLAGLRTGNPGPEKPRWLLLLFYRGYW